MGYKNEGDIDSHVDIPLVFGYFLCRRNLGIKDLPLNLRYSFHPRSAASNIPMPVLMSRCNRFDGVSYLGVSSLAKSVCQRSVILSSLASISLARASRRA